jgi:hypothetical protein
MVPRLVSLRPSDLALPKIDLNPKLIRTSFQPKFKAVSGVGLGVGTGTGFGLGGFGGGISNFNFFGIKGSGDRIAILMDVSVSMVEDERDGFAGFMRVKSRINEVVEKLDAAAFFNVIAFADAAESWQSQNGADTILVISDGLPQVEKGMSAQEEADYARKLADWQKRNAKAIANAETVEKKVWVPGYDGKLREGGPKGPKREGHFEMRSVRVGMPRGQPKPPKPEYWTLPDFLKHLEALHKALYAKKGRKLPVVHCIGYQIDSDGGRFLRKVAHTYKGNYRKVNRIR